MALLARSLARWKSWWSEELNELSHQLIHLTCTTMTSKTVT